MATTFGNRPEDTVADSRGNVLSGVVLQLYPTEADATARTALIASVTSNATGLWPYSDTAGRSLLWVRDPSGAVWPIGSEEALGDVAGKATIAYVDATFAPKSFLGMTFPSVIGNITALQAAADACVTSGNRLVSAGTMSTSTALTLKCDADVSAIAWTYTGTGTAITIGDATAATFRKTIKLPRTIVASLKATGWGAVAGSVGVDIVNAYSYDVTVPHVQGFETGLQTRGDSTNGTQQTSIHLGHLDNNKVNIRFTGTATGWSNQNFFFGGRCSHNSNEGVQVAGTRHIVFENLANPVNGHTFFGTSLESPDVVEYHVEAANTSWCTFIGTRYENTGGTAHRRFLVTGNSKNNILVGGGYVEDIVQTVTSPAQPFDVDSSAKSTRTGGAAAVPTLLLENINSSTAPALTIMPAGAGTAGTSPSTGYAASITANKWSGKRTGDSFNRLEMDLQNGRMYVGDATSAPAAYIGGSASAMFVGGSVPFLPLASATQDLGSASLKWRNLTLSGTATLPIVIQAPSTQTLASNGAVTINAALGDCTITLQANATSSSITNPVTSQKLTVTWVQDATGARTYAWPANCKFAGGAAPADTTASKRSSVTFIYDGTNWLELSRAVAVG